MSAHVNGSGLLEDTVEFRGTTYRVREITHGERLRIIAEITKDRYMGPTMYAVCGTVEPAITVEDAGNKSAQLIEALARKVMTLSGVGTEESAEGKG